MRSIRPMKASYWRISLMELEVWFSFTGILRVRIRRSWINRIKLAYISGRIQPRIQDRNVVSSYLPFKKSSKRSVGQTFLFCFLIRETRDINFPENGMRSIKNTFLNLKQLKNTFLMLKKYEMWIYW